MATAVPRCADVPPRQPPAPRDLHKPKPTVKGVQPHMEHAKRYVELDIVTRLTAPLPGAWDANAN